MQAIIHSRSQNEFRQLIELEDTFFEFVLPFKFKVETDFYHIYKSAFLRESLIFESSFSHNELFYQI